jgi:hypothetical protein
VMPEKSLKLIRLLIQLLPRRKATLSMDSLLILKLNKLENLFQELPLRQRWKTLWLVSPWI